MRKSNVWKSEGNVFLKVTLNDNDNQLCNKAFIFNAFHHTLILQYRTVPYRVVEFLFHIYEVQGELWKEAVLVTFCVYRLQQILDFRLFVTKLPQTDRM